MTPITRRIRRVAIIGAGPGGVVAAKGILAEIKVTAIDVFEQQVSFGGVWNYSNDPDGMTDVPQLNPDQPLEEPIWHPKGITNGHTHAESYATFVSPMYEQLETNIPHFLMKHSDGPSLEAHQLFPTREVVTQYLEEYAQDIKHLVRFQTQVIDVRRKCENAETFWLLKSKKLQSGETSESIYDAVIVANGHYTVPTLPNISGISNWNEAYAGVISHSKFYRRPEAFTNKKVIIVGNSASGTDIASQIATVCKHPVLISTRSDSPLTYEAGSKETVPEIVDFMPPAQGTRAVRFSNGRVEENVDAVLFCTGYYFSFPFLSSIKPKLISTGERVHNIYKHIFYTPDPTLAFIGLPYKTIPFRTFEGQAAVIARAWSRGLVLPSKLEMQRWEENLVAERGNGKPFHVLPFPEDFEYHNEMVAWASSAQGGSGKLPPYWTEKETWLRERFPAIKKAFADKGEERHRVRTVEELGFNYDIWRGENRAENGA